MDRSKLIQLIILSALAAAAAAALGALAYIKSGVFNVGASRPHTKFTEWITHETMIHSIRSHAKAIEAPARFTAPQAARGLCEYRARCAACHGAAGVARQRWADGMEPAPPYLLDATRKWRPRELFWIAKNGIKMTGMPSWRDELSDAQIWDVVAWLEASRQLPPQTYAEQRARCAPSGQPFPG